MGFAPGGNFKIVAKGVSGHGEGLDIIRIASLVLVAFYFGLTFLLLVVRCASFNKLYAGRSPIASMASS